MDVGGTNAQGRGLGLSESVTLREITNEARVRAMDEINGDTYEDFNNHLARTKE